MTKRRVPSSRLVLLAAVVGLLMPFAATGPAQAAPPSNDDRANAVVLSSNLPVTATGDSSEATALDATDPIDNCTGSPIQYTVWYQYSPTATGSTAFDISSNFGAGADFYRLNADGTLDQVACAGNTTLISLTAGETYLIMVGACCQGPLRGGTFSFTLSAPPPPVELQLTVSSASYEPRTAVTHLSGTYTCNTPAGQFVGLSGTIRQADKKTNSVIEDGFSANNGSGGLPACDTVTRTWSVAVAGQHLYSLTSILVTMQAVACDYFTCGDASVSRTLKLTKAR